jgi:hypothetical protein
LANYSKLERVSSQRCELISAIDVNAVTLAKLTFEHPSGYTIEPLWGGSNQ